ncbi:hypothetical protein [Sulfuriflexus sp.]|nr:hypothetical protein [Sulfuriflexus sp.]MDT8403250.1 hypothetical protein [Sulfuriflexus sp.]
MNNIYRAHVKQNANSEWLAHHLEDHLREMGQLAAEKAVEQSPCITDIR